MVSILGITDPVIIVGYGLAIIFGIACVIYGAKNWNNND